MLTALKFLGMIWAWLFKSKRLEYRIVVELPMKQDDVLQALSQFRQDRQDEFGIIRIGVFGSAARDQMSDESDVDVVVELTEPDLLTLVGIKQELESLFDRSVDIVRYRDKMNSFLKERIEQEAIYA
jgi:predicted nucleotidyltransferase